MKIKRYNNFKTNESISKFFTNLKHKFNRKDDEQIISDLIKEIQSQDFNFDIQITLSNYLMDIFTLNNIEVIKVVNENDDDKPEYTYSTKIDGRMLSCYQLSSRILYRMIYNILNKNRELLIELKNSLNSKVDMDRINEFEVIKNNKVDYINLNRLFDFYEKDFQEESMRVKIDKILEKYGTSRLKNWRND